MNYGTPVVVVGGGTVLPPMALHFRRARLAPGVLRRGGRRATSRPWTRGGWLFLRGTDYYGLSMFPMVADSLAMGCLLATMRTWLEQQNWYLRLFHPVASLGLLATILILNRLMGFTAVSVLGSSVVNVCLAILIHRSVHRSRDSLGRLLNWRPIASVGVLSYSLYLWQQLFLDRKSESWINAFPQNLLFAVGAALLSYFLLEKPVERLRHRLRA